MSEVKDLLSRRINKAYLDRNEPVRMALNELRDAIAGEEWREEQKKKSTNNEQP